jgi:RND family efflux transporter MFP subunit
MTLDKETLDGLRIDRPRNDRTGTPAWVWVLVVLVVVAGVGVAWAMVSRRGVEVRVAEAKAVAQEARGAVLNASGYVTARRQATVSSKVTGKVTEILIEEGMRVKRDQPIARLDEAYASKNLALAQAELGAASSAREETRVRIHEAQLDYDRAANLAKQQISSRADLDRARAQVDALRARLASQSDSLHVSQQQVALQRQTLDDTVIRAPFDGIVVSKDAQPGEMISPVSAGGGFTRTGICTIVDMDSLEIEVDVNEAYINRVSPGQRVEAVLDAYPDWRIPAHVITPVPTANREKATVKVRIAFDTKDTRILPDMGVKVSFISNDAAAATTTYVEVPKSAVRRNGEQDVVLVVKDDKAERRAVKVFTTSGDITKLASGVSAGEHVIAEGPTELKDGERVRVKVKE